MPYGASYVEAVRLCREWMIYLGAVDTLPATGAAAAVCDLYSRDFVAWVDNRRGNLDVDVVERAARVAASDGRRAVVFIPGGVRPAAQDLADTLGVALLRFGPYDGALYGANRRGRELRASGFAPGLLPAINE